MPRRKPRRRWWSYAIRKPSWWTRNTLYPWLIRALGGGDPTHVAISDGHAVLEVTSWGDSWFPYRHYVLRHPALQTYFVIPLRVPLAFRSHVKRGRRGPWRSFLAWITWGFSSTDDCVSVAKKYLAASGVAVPRSATTPQALWDWARKKGYDGGDFEGEADTR